MVFEQDNDMISAMFRKIVLEEIQREFYNGERLETIIMVQNPETQGRQVSKDKFK